MLYSTKAYRLAGPKGRRYVFEPVPGGEVVRVSRHEDFGVPRVERLSPAKARRLWSWLRKLGYKV